MNVADLLAIAPKLTDGPLVTPQPSLESILRDHYRRLAGDSQGDILADAYLERLKDAVRDGDARPRPADGRPQAARPTEPAPEPKPDAEEVPDFDPFDGLRRIGLDLRLGGMDVIGGLEHGRKGGSMMPLLTGIAGALLGAVATAETNRK